MAYNRNVGSLKDAQGIRKELRSLTIECDFEYLWVAGIVRVANDMHVEFRPNHESENQARLGR